MNYTDDRATKRQRVIGYFGPQKSSKGDRCVHLYPDVPGGPKWRCATVYEETFAELPDEIRIPVQNEAIIKGTAPGGSDMIPLDKPFDIEVYVNHDGTVSKDFARVLGPQELQAQAGQGSTPASFSLQQASVPKEFNALPTEEIELGFGEIVSESFVKMETLYSRLENFFGDLGTEGNGEWQRMVTSLVWRDANDQWRVVRPYLLKDVEEKADSYLDAQVILGGERESFLDNLAIHPYIADADTAKAYCKALGITSSGTSPAERLEQAKRVWLYATLLDSPYGLNHDRALTIVDIAYPTEQPF